jgi:hypothetical protein
VAKRTALVSNRLTVCDAAWHSPKVDKQEYSSHRRGVHVPGSREAKLERRKIERPPYEQLQAEFAASSFVAVGRMCGVLDNPIGSGCGSMSASGRGRSGDGC